MELVQIREAVAEEPSEVYEESLHDVNSIIMDVCASFGDTGAFEFRVSGFGDERWPVDVGTDLATVLEQLPDALSSVRNHEAFQIDFFEQGVQRRLEFVPNGPGYQVTCQSGTEWNPEPTVESVSAEDLASMLRALGQSFVLLTRKVLPRVSEHSWFSKFADVVVA
jgi:hypothetical protein